MSDKSLMNIHVHFLIVFSSAFSNALRVCSAGYCFKKFKHHKRCFGWASDGASNLILFQTRKHTRGVTPKNDLKRLWRVFSFSFDFVFVYLLPILKNVLEVMAERKKHLKSNKLHFNKIIWFRYLHIFLINIV